MPKPVYLQYFPNKIVCLTFVEKNEKWNTRTDTVCGIYIYIYIKACCGSTSTCLGLYQSSWPHISCYPINANITFKKCCVYSFRKCLHKNHGQHTVCEKHKCNLFFKASRYYIYHYPLLTFKLH